MCRPHSRFEPFLIQNLYAIAVVTLLSLFPSALRAQEPSSQSLREARRLEMEARQRSLWNLEKDAHKRRGEGVKVSREQRLAYQQFTEDFETLQVANYALVDAVGYGPGFYYGEVKKQAAEIKKRTSRLKETLLLPEPEEDRKQKKSDESLTGETLKAAITAINALVQSFVTNPMFQQLGTVDANNSMKARRDLDGIIRLSEQAHKCAEALNKAAGKMP
jgi:hypothetical protein